MRPTCDQDPDGPAVQAIETDAPRVLGRSLVERAHLHLEVAQAQLTRRPDAGERRKHDFDGDRDKHGKNHCESCERPHIRDAFRDRKSAFWAVTFGESGTAVYRDGALVRRSPIRL